MTENTDPTHDPMPDAATSAPPAPPPPPPVAQAAGANWALWAFAVAGVALAISAAGWFLNRAAIESLRQAQQVMADNLAGGGRQAVIDLKGAPALGPADAVVTLVEFSDYECPYCIRHFNQTMPQLVTNYVRTGKIRYVFRDWPVDQLHPEAIRGHEAAHCASEQNKFWEMHSRLFGPPGSHTVDRLQALARETGLDVAAFSSCLSSGRTRAGIRQTSQTAVELGATGTPAFFLGIRDPQTDKLTVLTLLPGALPYADFEKTIETLLARQR